MQPPVNLTPHREVHDESLLDWFLGLSVEQRLAELESRVAFLISIRVDELVRQKEATDRAKDQATLEILRELVGRRDKPR